MLCCLLGWFHLSEWVVLCYDTSKKEEGDQKKKCKSMVKQTKERRKEHKQKQDTRS